MMRPNGVEKQVRPNGWQPSPTALAWYQFNGDLNDSLGNYNMTELGSVIYSQGDLGNQAYFDNATYGVVMGNVGRTGEQSITIAFTYKAENDGYIVATWEYGGWMMLRNGWLLKTQSTGPWDGQISPQTVDNNWHCGIMTYDGSKVVGYLDGVKIGEYSATGGIYQYTGDISQCSMTLGVNRQSGGYTADKYNGYIHEVVIDSAVWDVTAVQDFTNYSLGIS